MTAFLAGRFAWNWYALLLSFYISTSFLENNLEIFSKGHKDEHKLWFTYFSLIHIQREEDWFVTGIWPYAIVGAR